MQCTSTEQKEETEQEQRPTNPALTQVWKTDTILTGSESALVHNNTIFVSNGNTNGTAKDGDGFLSKLNVDGSVKELKWVEGLNAPKGMAIIGGNLYVSDIDELVTVNLSSGTIENRMAVEGAVFLNDVATNGTDLFVSDTRTGIVYQSDGETYSEFATGVTDINGLAYSNNRMYGLNKEGLIAFTNEGGYKVLNTEVTGGDGLVILNDTTFVASRWAGQVYFISGNETTLLLNTEEEESNTADIGFIEEDSTVLVPTFLKNEVVAYKLTK